MVLVLFGVLRIRDWLLWDREVEAVTATKRWHR